MCPSSIFEDLQKFFTKEEEKIEKVKEEKMKILITSTSKFGQIVQMRDNKQRLFNLMRLFISSLSSIWIKSQIKSKKVSCVHLKIMLIFTDSEHMITSAIVNHDYNNYYSFEEVGVTCLFGIVCL